MTESRQTGSVPGSALLLSGLCLTVPLMAALLVPEWMEGDGALLVWVPVLIPGFLLAYHKGWTGASQALAGGMAALVLTHAEVLLLGVARPPFAVVFVVTLLLIVVAVGSGWLADLLSRERTVAEQMALTDQLTKIPNRRHAMIFLDAVWGSARRGTPLSLVMFDIDNFKLVNDRYGHAPGDEVLRSFGSVLSERTRAMDLSARLGGEEFLSILVDCSAADAARFAEDVRGKLSAVKHEWGHVTASAGVAEYVAGMGGPEAVLSAADRALYAAKEAGRDRVRRADLLALETPTAVSPVTPTLREGAPGEKARVLENATVLLVDDDPGLLRATRRALETLGCRVEGFTNPFDAVRHVQDRKVAPHLLVTDVVMPEMSGFALVDMMGRLVRGVPVLYVSGYDQREMYWSGAPGARSALLAKPFTADELATALVDLLGLDSEREPAPAPAEPARATERRAHVRPDARDAEAPEGAPLDRMTKDIHGGRILIVDDDVGLLRSLRRLFEEKGYTSVRCFAHPSEALEAAAAWKPDLVLADIHMPVMDGLEVMTRFRALVGGEDFVPFIILTGDEDRKVRREALERGASDFLVKPLDSHETLTRSRNALRTRFLHRRVLADKGELERRVSERTWELASTRTEILHRLARAAEYRDDITGRHAARVGLLAALIAAEAGMTTEDRELIRRTAPLHDMGKIGIPDRILHKAGPLTDAEFEIMKRHTLIGGRILEGGRHRILRMARDIAEAHHEKWDGAGYPHGLAGTDIPVEARIVAVADTFDVLMHTRPYKVANTPSQAVDEIVRCRGTHFDPKFADALHAISERVGPDGLPRLIDPIEPWKDTEAPQVASV